MDVSKIYSEHSLNTIAWKKLFDADHIQDDW